MGFLKVIIFPTKINKRKNILHQISYLKINVPTLAHCNRNKCMRVHVHCKTVHSPHHTPTLWL